MDDTTQALQDQYDWLNRSFSPGTINDTLDMLYEYASTIGLTLKRPESDINRPAPTIPDLQRAVTRVDTIRDEIYQANKTEEEI
jgi:hypothetical protein